MRNECSICICRVLKAAGECIFRQKTQEKTPYCFITTDGDLPSVNFLSLPPPPPAPPTSWPSHKKEKKYIASTVNGNLAFFFCFINGITKKNNWNRVFFFISYLKNESLGATWETLLKQRFKLQEFQGFCRTFVASKLADRGKRMNRKNPTSKNKQQQLASPQIIKSNL